MFRIIRQWEGKGEGKCQELGEAGRSCGHMGRDEGIGVSDGGQRAWEVVKSSMLSAAETPLWAAWREGPGAWSGERLRLERH